MIQLALIFVMSVTLAGIVAVVPEANRHPRHRADSRRSVDYEN